MKLWEICGIFVNRINLYEFFMMNIDQNKKVLNDFYEEFNKERNKYTHKINSIHVGNDNEAI